MNTTKRILRSWSARALPANADRYVAFFDRTLRLELSRIEGFCGAVVSTRRHPEDSGEVVIDVVTTWASMEAIARFAGDAIDRAVVEPEARELLSSFDECVVHHDERLRISV